MIVTAQSKYIPAAEQKTVALSASESKHVLDSFYQKLHNAKTLKGKQQLISEGFSGQIIFEMMKGGYSRERTGTVWTNVSDGKVDYIYYPEKKIVSMVTEQPGTPFMYGLESFSAVKRPAYTKTGTVKKGSFNGKPAYLITEGQMSIAGSMVTVYVDPKTDLPLSAEYTVEGVTEWYVYSDLVFDSPMSAKDFTFTIPKGVIVNDLRT